MCTHKNHLITDTYGVLLTIAITTLASSGCAPTNAPAPTISTPKSVSIGLTPVKNQYSVGFCWSYTVTAMIEAEAKRHGKTLNLSEEYLGFYNLLIDLQAALKDGDATEISEGAFFNRALLLPAIVGMVPESVFTKKFGTQDMDTRLQARVNSILDDPGLTQQYIDHPEMTVELLATEFGTLVPAPNTEFTYEGNVYTPVTFARDYLGYRNDDYAIVKVTPTNEQDVMESLKVSLTNGHPVPIAVTTYENVPKQGAFDLKHCKGTECVVEGAHAMLAVDFLTKNGRFGSMSPTELDAVYYNDLTGLLLKNSWGPNRGLTQNGDTHQSATDGGFYSITREYMMPPADRIKDKLIYPTVLVLRYDMSPWLKRPTAP